MRAKNIRIAYCQSWRNFDYTRAKRVERELSEYKRAREQGIQPAGTKLSQVRDALDISDAIGKPYDAGSTKIPFPEE